MQALKFQFLWGAIKVQFPPKRRFRRLQFQFLWGAIKVHYPARVQLSRLSFQFLWGAIKVNFQSLSISFQERYFNSCEVRLRSSCFYGFFAFFAHFNSCEVRLRFFGFCTSAAAWVAYFNSCEVRLRFNPPEINRYLGSEFQFLWGAIKVLPPRCLLRAGSTFQFLWGAIKVSSRRRFRRKNYKRFQFLWGAIKVCQTIGAWQQCSVISIPVRCD